MSQTAFRNSEETCCASPFQRAPQVPATDLLCRLAGALVGWAEFKLILPEKQLFTE